MALHAAIGWQSGGQGRGCTRPFVLWRLRLGELNRGTGWCGVVSSRGCDRHGSSYTQLRATRWPAADAHDKASLVPGSAPAPCAADWQLSASLLVRAVHGGLCCSHPIASWLVCNIAFSKASLFTDGLRRSSAGVVVCKRVAGHTYHNRLVLSHRDMPVPTSIPMQSLMMDKSTVVPAASAHGLTLYVDVTYDLTVSAGLEAGLCTTCPTRVRCTSQNMPPPPLRKATETESVE